MSSTTEDIRFEIIPDVMTGTLSLKGWMDERIETSGIRQTLLHLLKEKTKITLDLGDLDRANSSGLRFLAILLQEFSTRIGIKRLPAFFVELINVAAIIPDSVEIISFHVPFYHPKTDHIEEICLEIGKDIPLKDNYEDFDCMALVSRDSGLIPDFEPQEFFTFLTERLQKK